MASGKPIYKVPLGTVWLRRQRSGWRDRADRARANASPISMLVHGPSTTGSGVAVLLAEDGNRAPPWVTPAVHPWYTPAVHSVIPAVHPPYYLLYVNPWINPGPTSTDKPEPAPTDQGQYTRRTLVGVWSIPSERCQSVRY